MKAVFAGTFDPITLGHWDIIKRASRLFQHLTIAVAHNPKKNHWLDLATRLRLIEETVQTLPNVSVVAIEGLIADYTKQKGISILIRGVRSQQDLLFENQMALTNQQLNKSLETFLLMASPQVAHISSSLIRDIHHHQGQIDSFVPPAVFLYLQSHGS